MFPPWLKKRKEKKKTMHPERRSRLLPSGPPPGGCLCGIMLALWQPWCNHGVLHAWGSYQWHPNITLLGPSFFFWCLPSMVYLLYSLLFIMPACTGTAKTGTGFTSSLAVTPNNCFLQPSYPSPSCPQDLLKKKTWSFILFIFNHHFT